MSKAEMIWRDQNIAVANRIKILLLKHYSPIMLDNFKKRLGQVLNKYLRHLPLHVSQSEMDDLKTVVSIEFFESIKVWNPFHHPTLWPLAYQRINGAMRDHIRFVTRSDPSRFYEWVNTAANMYIALQKNNTFSDQVDNKEDLKAILSILSTRDQEIVIQHTVHDKTFKQIGDMIKLSESQVSRIYKKSIQLVRDSISQSDKSSK